MRTRFFNDILIFIERYLPLFLVCAFIFIQSSKTASVVSSVGWLNYFIHKLAHVVIYATLFLTACRALRDKKVALIFVAFYAVSDEYHQMFVLTRTPSFTDVVIDITAASGVYYLSDKYTKFIPKVLKEFFHI